MLDWKSELEAIEKSQSIHRDGLKSLLISTRDLPSNYVATLQLTTLEGTQLNVGMTSTHFEVF
jgi:hypothetical protein